jgi:hypothetical protein
LSRCPQKVQNLLICYKEDREVFDVESTEYLIKQTIRLAVTRKELFGHYRARNAICASHINKPKENSGSATSKINRRAFLFCAGREEFSKCRPSK